MAGATSHSGRLERRRDELEAVLSRLVCSGRMPLAEAQQAIAVDWTAAYNRFVVEK
jgi:hypothetical protein